MSKQRILTRPAAISALTILAIVAAFPVSAQWVEFEDETVARLNAPAALGSNDSEEKDYAWGDVDNDGDTDLVIVRKQPFTSPGKRTNVLLINENGVLVDRTNQFATDSDVPGDFGFETATNDRDVQLVDLNNDGWLDIVTAVTISDGDPKHIGHPRIYVNKGDFNGNWLGFRYEDARIPTMLSYSGQSGFNPRFCSVAVGDVTGDGMPDLWFGDYDSSGAGGFGQPSGADYNDRLLVNNGTGFFSDQTQTRFSGLVDIPGSADAGFEVSAFGAAAGIADMNGDGYNDVIKQTSLNNPLYVGIAYNDALNEGFFDTYDVVNNQAPYFVSIGDLNNDGQLDLVITDDGADRYMLNQGGNTPDFLSFVFSYDAASDDTFGSNSVITDLNNDGWNDVLIADVDVDISGCSRRMHIFRNLTGVPGDNITLQEQTTGSNCQNNFGNPSQCVVTSIPSNKLEGVHDVAVFDIDNDGWKDLVVGRCATTEIYMNQPPTGLTFTYPQGLPFFLAPGQPTTVQVQVSESGVSTPIPGTGRMFASVAGGPFNEVFMTELSPNLYEGSIPAAPNCTDPVEFYVLAKAAGAGTFSDPPSAPTQLFRAIAAFGTAITFEDGMEGDVSAWTVVNDPSLISGAWEQAEPNGTLGGGGQQAAPDEDGEAGQSQVKAFITENGLPGGDAGASDIDGGPTDLISPVIDLLGTDANIAYNRWFFTDGDDTMTVWVTADGTNWLLVETISGTNGAWESNSFRVGDFVTPTSTVQVRFRAGDSPNNSITEAGLDAFRVEQFLCASCSTPADCDDDVFCNGAEQCVDNACLPGEPACPGEQCDEGNDVCVECLVDEQCADSDFCNGTETCSGNVCVTGGDPCTGQFCDEVNDVCAECVVDADCDDGVFCNFEESCIGGVCATAGEPCPGQLCDEDNDVCVGTVELQPRMGMPLLRLTAGELDRFNIGRNQFDTVFSEPDGLGPIFNQDNCAGCHSNPVGGSGTITVTRFGFNDDKGGGFDPLTDLGGSLRQSQATLPACVESVPPEANVTAQRLTTSVLGSGLVESIADSDIEANALAPPVGVSGTVHMVPVLESPGPLRVGRFGWKSQLATLLSFSADAALNEMGITSRVLPNEEAPNGDQALLATCDTVPDPEDGPDGQGFDFIDRVTDFQRFLAAPPQTPRSGMTGEAVFNTVSCNSCHLPAFVTADNPGLEDALRDRILKPYSDFLLHDMGESADFIEQGGAGSREMRTTALWGVRVRDPLWHDGRVAGGTFEDRVLAAIQLHDAIGSEAQASAQTFNALSSTDKDALIAFLDSLGRAEFDQDGDNDVDQDDFAAFELCRTGPGSFYTPDDACSISDVDQDGDVDDDDFALFLAGSEGQAGESTQLIVDKAPGGDVSLSWSDSCLAGDLDYGVYEGNVGDFASHGSRVCSTAGSTVLTLTPAPGDVYFLVVPTNGFREGSYGVDSSGTPRVQGGASCFPQSVGACE